MNGQTLMTKTLWAAAWIGNFLLTALAFVLAVTHEGPLTPVVFLTVAVCILSGNLLPLAYYYVSYLWANAELEAERAQAPDTLREAVVRMDQLDGRFNDLRDSVAKALLLARQLPEQIDAKSEALMEALDAFDVKRIEALAGRMDAAIEGAARAASRTDDIAELIAGELDARRHLIEKLEAAARVEEEVEEEVEGEVEGEGEVEEEDEVEGEADWEEVDEEVEVVEEDNLDEEVVEEAKVEETIKVVGRKKREEGPDLFAGETIDVAKPTRTGNGEAVLVARAMIGIANRLYVRGNGGGLSEEHGTLLELTGIGEYRWNAGKVTEPVTCRLYLNDAEPAEGGELVLEPGAILEVRPQFGRE